jgi:hypothetical protein
MWHVAILNTDEHRMGLAQTSAVLLRFLENEFRIDMCIDMC